MAVKKKKNPTARVKHRGHSMGGMAMGNIKRYVFTILAFAALGMLVVLGMMLFTAVVPYNTDEFIHYDTIACHLYPGNNINGDCDPFMLNFIRSGIILPLRAYHYSGSFPSLYYLPIHLLWNTPIAARLFNVFLLVCGAMLLAKRYRFDSVMVSASLLLFFPYLFQHVVDTGPVSFQIFSVYTIVLLLDRWIARYELRWILLAGAISFACIWTKFSFFWLCPGLFLIFIETILRRKKNNVVKTILHPLAAALVTLIPLVLLLLSSSPHGDDFPYLSVLKNSNTIGLGEFFRFEWIHSAVVVAFTHPLEATQRVFFAKDIPVFSLIYSILIYSFTPISLLAYIVLSTRSFRKVCLSLIYYGAFLLTVFMIIRTRDSWAMHHAILSFPFLILAALSTVRLYLDHAPKIARFGMSVFGAVFLVMNIVLFCVVPSQTVRAHDDPSKFLVQRIIRQQSVAERYTVLTVDWGVFFQAALFGGGDQSVIFARWVRDEQRVKDLQSLAAEYGRKIMIVYRLYDSESNTDMIKNVLGLVPCVAVPGSSEWQIAAEPDESYASVCEKYAGYPHNFFEKVLLTY